MIAWNNESARKAASLVCLLGLALVALYLCYLIAKPFFGPVLIAVMLGVVFYPLHARIRSFVHRPTLASLVSTFLVFLVATIPLMLLGTAVRDELRAVVQSLRETGAEGGLNPHLAHWRNVFLERVGNYVDLGQFDLHAALLRWAEQASRYLLSIGTIVISNLFSFALNTVVVFFTLFFFFREGKGIRHTLSDLLPFDVEQTNRLFKGISETIVGNLYGSLAVGVAQGTLTGVAFWVLGLSAPVLWALATVLASLVPIVGSALVWVPASFVLIMTGHWIKALLLLVWGAAVVGQIDVVVRPWVVGAHVKVHTLLVFFALLGGAKAFGIIGIFVGPIILSFMLVLIDMLRTASLSWRSASESEQLVSVAEKQIR
jgi:predicted PurR-regulated permease PerM